MYRKKFVHGCCVVFFGLGLVTGHCLESWILCCMGGTALIFVGLWSLSKK